MRRESAPPRAKRRSAPGFDLLGTLAWPGGSTAVVLEIPREAGLSVIDLTPAPRRREKGYEDALRPGDRRGEREPITTHVAVNRRAHAKSVPCSAQAAADARRSRNEPRARLLDLFVGERAVGR